MKKTASFHVNKKVLFLFAFCCFSIQTVLATVTNTTTTATFPTLQAAIDDAGTLAGHTLEFNSGISEGLVTVNKAVTIDGNGFTLTSTSISWGINPTVAGVSIIDLTVEDAGTFGIITGCGADNLALTNVIVNSCGGTGISLSGSDNLILTNITSTNNTGNGISVSNCDNVSIVGLTTSGNSFGLFGAGIGLFTTNTFCLPAGINGFSLTGTVSIAENPKVYSQKQFAADVITGISGSSISWAVGVGALDRSYWPDKPTAYAVVDALFEAPYNYPNTAVYVAEIATENFYVDDNPNGDAVPPMLIQTAINFEVPNKTIFVESGTYNEQAIVNKGLTIQGLGLTQPTVDFTGTVSGKPTLFDISADAVTIDNIHFNVDLSKLKSAIIASGAAIDNIIIKNNIIDAYGTPSAGTYGDRNAVSINYTGSTNYRVATGGVNSITFDNNTVNGTLATGSYFRAGIATDESGGTFTNNTLQTINHDILARFGSNGNITITGNNLNGGGVELSDMNAGAGILTVANNIFNAAFANASAPGTAVLRLQNNYNAKTTLVNNNTFSNHQWAVSLANYNAVSLDNNTFTPLAGSTTFHHVAVNTKSISTNSASIVQVTIGAVFTNNTFNGSGSFGGTALSFHDHDSIGASFGTITIGTAGNENKFNDGIAKNIYLDHQSGTSSGSTFPAYTSLIGAGAGALTTMALWVPNLDATNNTFDVGAGLQLPTAMSLANLFTLEDRIQHAIDASGLGFVLVKANNDYVTLNSFVSPLTTVGSIQRGVNASSNGWTVNVNSGTFSEDVTVNKQVTVLGQGIGSSIASGAIGGGGATFQVTAGNVIIDGFTITRDGNTAAQWNLALNTAGIAIQSQGNFAEVRNCEITGNRTGIDINNSNGNNIHNNNIHFNRTGMIFRNQTDNTSVLNNFIKDNWTAGVLFLDGSGGTNVPVQSAANSFFNNNDISLNWYGQIQDRQSGGSLPAPGTNLKNFTCNWYGVIPPTTSTVNSTEPGYSAQIPVIYGGAAVPPGGQTDVSGTASANLTYIPYLTSGTDVGGITNDGFQPVAGCLAPCVLVISTSSTNEICPTFNNGTASVTIVSGGTGPYTYSWNTSPVQTTATATALVTGTYTVTVTDLNGCTASKSEFVGTDYFAPVKPSNDSSTVECAPTVAPVPPVVVDACGDTITPGAPAVTGSYSGCEGTRIYTYTYNDIFGGSTTWTYKYTIDHTIPPVVPVDGAAVATCPTCFITPTPPVVVDVCGDTLTPVMTTISVPDPLICEGTKTFIFTYTDCSGLISVWKFVYTVSIDDQNVCTIDACNTATGITTHTQISRDDSNPCTDDFCDPVTGLLHTPIDVNDNDVCTTDACNTANGNITHVALNANDGNACTTDGCDSITGLFHTPVDPNDGDLCTIDGCDPVSGIFNTPINIDDNNACTADGCASGVITHIAVVIDDSDVCTTDACDIVSGAITHTPVSIDDFSICTTDGCNSVSGIFHTPISTDDLNACTTDGCDFLTGFYHIPVNTNDNDICTTDGCLTDSGVFHNAVNTDDNNACTTDGCDVTTGVFHNAININDNDVCTTDACDTSSGSVTHVALNTNDGNACTTDGCDSLTGIFHTPVDPNDGNACTIDGCDPVSGIFNIPINIDDNNACTTDGCASGVITHTPVVIDDSNVCTTDACDIVTGAISHTPVSFDDFSVCTEDGCNSVSGIFHNLISTDDNNQCTIDGCDFLTGPYHIPVNTNDNDICTTDGCVSNSGIFNTPVNTNDNNACTIDGCDPFIGVYHNPVDISDQDVCTTDACNTTDGSITHIALNTDDGNACTTDGCNSITGAFHTPVSVEDNNPCTFDGCNPVTGVYHIDQTPSTPISGGNQVQCQQLPFQTLTATAFAPGGASVVWYDAPTGGNIVLNPILNSAGTITYYAESKLNSANCSSLTRTAVSLTIYEAVTSNAGPDQTQCNSSSFTLAGSAPAPGTGLWSIVSGTAVITSPSAAGSTVTGVPSGTSVTLRWTVTNGTCSAYDDVVLTNNAAVTANAGPDQTQCNNGNFTLNGSSAAPGTGLWSVVTGSAIISNPISSNSPVSGLAAGSSVTLRWTVTNGTCSASDDVVLTNDAPVSSNAGPDQTQCNSGTFTLAGSAPAPGTGLWTIVSGTAIITTPSSAGTTVTSLPSGTSVTLRWTVTNGTCFAFDEVVLTNNAAVTANAGPDQTQCNNGSFTLNGSSASPGTGLWTVVTGSATITNPIASNSSVSGLAAGSSVTLRWTVTNGTCSASDDVVLTSDAPVSANAGPDQTQCNNASFTLAGSAPAPGTGLWTIVSGTATITTPNAAGSTVTAVPSGTSVTLRWTVTNNTCSAFDDVVLTNNAAVTANAGPDQTQCNNGSFTLNGSSAAPGTGLWTVVTGSATIVNPISSNSPVTGLVAGSSVTLRWTVTNGTCSASDDVVLTNNAPVSANAGPDQTQCNSGSFTLAGSAPAPGTGLWSIVSGTATITTPTAAGSTVTAVPSGTSVTLRWTVTNNTCSAFDDVVLTNNAAVTANAGPDQTQCNNGFYLLTANTPTPGTGSWSLISGTASIGSPTSFVTIINGVPAGTSATLRWTITNGTCSSTDDVVLTNNQLIISNAGTDQTQCNNGSFTLNGNSPSTGVGIWTVISGSASISSPLSQNSSISGIPAGTSATLRWTIVNGTCSSSDDVVLTNYSLIAANAGPDQVQCSNATFILAGNIPSPGTGVWTLISGTAVISSPGTANTSVIGIPLGTSVTLRWTITNGDCSSFDEVTLTLNPIDDFNACTIDVCNVVSGLVAHNPVVTEDGNACTTDGCNSITGIFHTPVNPNDNNLCTIDGCDPVYGIFNTPVDIDDNNICTKDICIPALGTFHDPVDVDDFNACTSDGCDPNIGVYHFAFDVNDNNVCTSDFCSPDDGTIFHIPLNTDDGSACTTDGCNSITGEYHIPVTVNDGNACTSDGCDPVTGVYHNAVSITDFNACTNDACNTANGNITHISVNINDNNVCTTDACDIVSGAISHVPVSIDDFTVCTADGCNSVTGVFHTPLNTNDGNVCTTDGCDALTGIYHTPLSIDDFTVCTTDGCNSITGVYHNPVNTNDANACTSDGCDPLTGVYHLTVNSNDNNLCTADGCNSISGVYNNPISVDDLNGCTTDGCVSTTGIYHTTVNIDDNSVCTTDACNPSNGSVTHIALNINDGNVCTTDGCDPITGIFHTAIDIDDLNPCTIDGCDPITGVNHVPVNVDDNNNCTVDECDPRTGAIINTNAAPIVTATPGTIACYGGSTCVTVTAAGGFPPYIGVGQVCGYVAGSYYFLVADAHGCLATSVSVEITQPNKFEVTTTKTNASCNTASGTATAIVTGGTPPYSYLWTNGQMTQTATGLAAGSYTVVVTDGTGCTTSTVPVVITTSGSAPAAPAVINGPTVMCKGQCITYSIASVPGATSYTWTLPSGTTGSSTSTSITICAKTKFNGGFLCVKANSPCGSSAYTCLKIDAVISRPATPATINGNFNVCATSASTETYCIAAIPGATGYIWSIYGNATPSLSIASGQGTLCIVVNVPAGYPGNQYIKVYATNCKGNGYDKKIKVNRISTPSQPGSINGSSSVCKSVTSSVYSVSSVSGVTYNWTASGSATIASGQGTSSITINFTTSVSSPVTVSVTASNACGISTPSTKNVTVNNCRIAANEVVPDGAVNSISSFTAYPNPSQGKFILSFNSDKDARYALKVVDVLGNILINSDLSVTEGFNSREINLENVAAGLYFVSIQSEGSEVQTLRIVVE